jgi:hypothetical protein
MNKKDIILEIKQVIVMLEELSGLYVCVPGIIRGYRHLLDELNKGKDKERIQQILYFIFRVAADDERFFDSNIHDKIMRKLNAEIKEYISSEE